MDLLTWWRKTKTKGVIIGGLAVAFRGRPRTTNDVDAIVFVQEDQWSGFLAKGQELSFHSRVPDPLAFARESRIFVVRHEKTGTNVDLALGATEFELGMLKRASKVRIERTSISVAAAEDLIVLKAIANRPIDDMDILGLLEYSSDLDFDHVRHHIEQLAGLLEMPELVENFEDILAKHKKRHGRQRKRP